MKSRFSLILILLGLTLTACNFSLAEDITPPPDYVPPTPAPTLGPLFPAQTPDLSNGATIYAEKCAACHGETGMGDGEQGKQLPVSVAALGLPEVARQASPAKWFTVVTQGNLDNFMPPFTSLSEQERWDVVAYALSLSSDKQIIDQGKALYQANCLACHGPDGSAIPEFDLSDQSVMAEYSAANLFDFTSTGAEPKMPAYKDKLSEDDLWALTAYMRTFTFSATETVTPTAASTPTPEPGSTSEATPPADTTTTPVGMGFVSGKVTNGSGGDVPSGLTVDLRIFEHDQSGNFTPVDTQGGQVQPNGSYRFDNVELNAQRVYLTTVEYLGIQYQSEMGFVTGGENKLDLPVTIYDTSSDPSPLTVDRWHIFLNFTEPGSVQVIELVVITNPSMKAIIPDPSGTPALTFHLPEGAVGLQFEDSQTPGRYVQSADGTFGDTSPVLPGVGQHEVVFAYNLPYDKKMDFTQQTDLPVDAAVVMAPQGIKVQSDLLSSGGTRDFQGMTYSLYNSQPLPASGEFSMTVSGQPAGLSSSDSTQTQPNTRRNLLIGVGTLGVVLILVGGWLYWRERSQAEETDDELDFVEEEAEADEADTLMDAIIALDDLHRAGKIPDEAYHQRRLELKEQLKKVMK
jgi:mono/diheme cytochrome c family protein